MNWPWTKHATPTPEEHRRNEGSAVEFSHLWDTDLGDLVAGIRRRTGLSRLEVITLLTLNATNRLANAIYAQGQRVNPLIDESLKHLRDDHNDDDWKTP